MSLAIEQMIRLGMVLRMRVLPREVRHEQEGMQHQADAVVQSRAGAEAAMAALMGEDPTPCERGALQEPVRVPCEPAEHAAAFPGQ